MNMITRTSTGARCDARSILEYAAIAEARPDREMAEQARSGERTPAVLGRILYSEWAGAPSHAEAVRMAREGSPEHREMMAKGIEAVRPFTVNAPQIYRRRDVAGDHPDMGRAAAGDPLSMYRRAKRDVAVKPVSRWLVNLGGNWKVKPQAKVNRGAAILALLDSVESAGIRVELEACMSVRGMARSCNTWDTRIMVKNASEPLDLDVAAFVLVCPALLRWLDHGIRHHVATERHRCGASIDTPAHEREGRVYFQAVHDTESCWLDPESAAQAVRAKYEAALAA
jgi:hypothetical protein